MNNSKQINSQRVAFLEQDPCLRGLVSGSRERDNLHNLDSQTMSTYESAMILARLLTPESEDSTEEKLRRPIGSISLLDMPPVALSSAS